MAYKISYEDMISLIEKSYGYFVNDKTFHKVRNNPTWEQILILTAIYKDKIFIDGDVIKVRTSLGSYFLTIVETIPLQNEETF
jgi:hypothetical protein